MKKAFFLLLILGAALGAGAQARFLGQVKIEYERTVNVPAYYKDLDGEWYERIKERLPKQVTTYHEFIGDSTRSLYHPGKEAVLDPRSWYRPVADKNVIYTDFRAARTVAQKPVYEETFLIEDSLSKIKWRLTADTRVIAGYECRKAIGILDDSVAIFAFYTDEILIPGGPEGIQGLPGMILGMGVPRLHTTWFATKVDVFDIPMSTVKPATKGKKTSRAAMMKQVGEVLRDWGSFGSKMVVNFTI
ncbi:GLPGLI family protein [Flaviaesturariibacter flavus]|uniref:GLPGLI family protein n=1 Tax=Flaviaesturariibacter flavus TaxID=2502780 RepID=A0A4R1BNZ9_9BACT|nr:GLPGLI family protein [Flaviaesturariibacter flavus]TCJ19168.1 GLPGLI family protein [Flaviaesturariibacter flavus]